MTGLNRACSYAIKPDVVAVLQSWTKNTGPDAALNTCRLHLAWGSTGVAHFQRRAGSIKKCASNYGSEFEAEVTDNIIIKPFRLSELCGP